MTQLERSWKNVEPSGPSDPGTDPIEHLLWAALLQDATPVKAREAQKRLLDEVSDFNELRVLLVEELAALLGPRYPNVHERSARLKMMLNDVYNREHCVSLESQTKAQKRDIKKYLESIDGVSPFVMARVFALAFGGHAIPVDDRLLEKLIAAGVFDEGTAVTAAAGSLERAIKASDSTQAIAMLEAWAADDAPVKPIAGKAASKKTTKKAASKKKTTKKAATKKTTRKKTTKKTTKKTSRKS